MAVIAQTQVAAAGTDRLLQDADRESTLGGRHWRRKMRMCEISNPWASLRGRRIMGKTARAQSMCLLTTMPPMLTPKTQLRANPDAVARDTQFPGRDKWEKQLFEQKEKMVGAARAALDAAMRLMPGMMTSEVR